jgi:outer membrane protein assembly factor BamB
MTAMFVTALSTFLIAVVSLGPQASLPDAEELFAAARAGDAARVQAALDKGVDVNAKARYGMTALSFAADRGLESLVKLLIDRGANVNVQDTFYQMRPIDLALSNGHVAVARLLLERGSRGAASALMTGIRRGDQDLVKVALQSTELTAAQLDSAVALAKTAGRAEILSLVTEKAAATPRKPVPAVAVERAVLQSYVGTYRNSDITLLVTLEGEQLKSAIPGQPARTLVPTSSTNFTVAGLEGVSFAFAGRGGMVERIIVNQNNSVTALERVSAEASGTAASTAAPPDAAQTPAMPLTPAKRGAPRPWPGFRGSNAAGNGDGQGIPSEWDVASGTNVRWKTAIPGIANASPIAWGNRVFVTTAISSACDKTFRTGLYGDVAPVQDLSDHTWKVYCLDRTSGKVLWERTAFSGAPKVKRHTKASQANSTPVTDGKRVVAIFGSIGLLAAWDADGKPLWTSDIGVIDSGWFLDPAYQWGHSSSPIIHRNAVIVQADGQKNPFIAAYDLGSGKHLWRAEREHEISTWGTPTVVSANGRDEIVTNGTKVRSYDAATGRLLWTLGPNSEVTVATPVVGDGLVFVTGGYPPVRPIYAVRPGASGDISLPKDQTSSAAIAWSNDQGTYIPSPIYYDGILYTLGNNGVLTAFDGKTGERLYRSRVGGGGAYAASPVAADGRLFVASEDGDIFVVRAGRTYQEIAKNQMKEVIMSTPAISDGMMFIRTLGHVYAVGGK